VLEHSAIAKQSKEEGAMGQSSGNGRGENVAEAFESLAEIIGDWLVEELLFRAPDAEPVVNTGRTTCRAAIGGLAIVVTNDMPTSRERTVSLFTFNPKDQRFEFGFVNSASDLGIIRMTGRSVMTRSSEEIRARFGKAAMEIREWTLAPGQAEIDIGLTRLVENQISQDLWVLQFFAQGSHGEFLIRQQVLTRAQPGCQPQVGCELGCPGLVGCQEGCRGLQGPGCRPRGQAQLGCACETRPGCA
jgi:hypothetical protein